MADVAWLIVEQLYSVCVYCYCSGRRLCDVGRV